MFHRLLDRWISKSTLRADIANSLGADTVQCGQIRWPRSAERRHTGRGRAPWSAPRLVGPRHRRDRQRCGGHGGAGGRAHPQGGGRAIRRAPSGSHCSPARKRDCYGSQAYAERTCGASSRTTRRSSVSTTGPAASRVSRCRGTTSSATAGARCSRRSMRSAPSPCASRNKGGTDHLSFLPYGVPAFNYDQETRGYNHTHHSQADTYDHVVLGDRPAGGDGDGGRRVRAGDDAGITARGPATHCGGRTVTAAYGGSPTR